MLNKENTNKIKNLIESKKYKTALEIIEEYFQSPLLNGDDEKILLDLKYEINEIVQNEIDQKTKKTTVELLNLLEKNELESFFKFYEKTLDELDEEKKYEFYNKIFTNNKISNFVKLELLDDFYKQKNIDLNRINISNSLTFKKFNCSTFSNFLKF
jgi:ribosomal protein L22